MKKLFALFATATMIFAAGCGENMDDVNPDKPNQGQEQPDKPDQPNAPNPNEPPIPDLPPMKNNSDDVCTAMNDINFMNYCYENLDVNKDGKVTRTEADAVRKIDISNLDVTSIQGIGYFTNLETFICESNPIREAELRLNSKLTSFVFKDCKNLETVLYPKSMTKIADNAFYNCKKLKSITIYNGITTIGDCAFKYCNSLEAVYITDIAKWCEIQFYYSLDNIYHSNPLFYAKRLYLNGKLVTNLIIPNSIKRISSLAFCGCNLTSITIPDSVTSIGTQAFYGCTGKCIIDSNSISNNYEYFDWNRNHYSSSPFYKSKFSEICICNSVTSIGDYAFCDCSSLTSITIPDSVTSIGEDAFYNCSSLSSVFISDIAKWCTIEFNSSNSNPLFYAHNLYLNDKLVTDLVIPDSVTSIGDYAFSRCSSLTRITIPDSVTSIEEYAFYGCSSLTSINIPDGVTSIEGSAFSNCSSLTSINIPDGVTSIGNSAFSYCSSLTSITIGNGVTSIGEDAFYNCSSLTSITIPNSVTSIGKYAFYYCSNLTNIYSKPTIPPTLGVSALEWIPSYVKIYVPTASVDAYKSAKNWSSYAWKIIGYDFNEQSNE